METRASHLLIGSFVLLFIGGIFAFAIWLAGADLRRDLAYYQVNYEESVSGLSVGGDVRYRGIKIGRVADIGVNPGDPQKVAVRIEVDRKHKIRDGDIAKLSFQGVTGIAFVNIQGAVAGGKELISTDDSILPVIPSETSDIEQLMQGAPNLIAQGTILAERISDIFNEDNRELVNGILIGVNNLTVSLVDSSQQFEKVMNTAERASLNVAKATESISKLSDQASLLLTHVDETVGSAKKTIDGTDQIFQNDVKQLIAGLKDATLSINELSVNANSLIDDNRESLQGFTADGLNEFTRFVTEARILVSSLSRVVERFESEGTRFLFQTKEAEYRPN